MALALAVVLPAFSLLVRRDRAATAAMRAAASALLSLLVLQILLGMQIIFTARQPDVTTAHVLVGAMTLATTFWLTWVAHRDAIETAARPGRRARDSAIENTGRAPVPQR